MLSRFELSGFYCTQNSNGEKGAGIAQWLARWTSDVKVPGSNHGSGIAGVSLGKALYSHFLLLRMRV